MGAAFAVAELAKSEGFDTVLFGANSAGLELAPRVAVKLDAGYVADCVGLEFSGDIIASKPVYAGKAIVKTKVTKSHKVFTLRPNVFTATKSNAVNTEFINKDMSVSADNLKVKVTSLIKNEGKIDVAEADRIVTGGRGFKGPENFFLVENLAKALGGAVGASRAVVDAGWRPHGEQVGQTGKTVSPNLYVACAVSGAVQHLAGMSSSKIIVAINKDKDAPIFKVCDYGIVGDVFEVLPKLTEAVKKFRASH
jgi:electron transfer flavoprotein alpha subunit